MDFEFLDPMKKRGFQQLEVRIHGEKISHFKLVTTPRKLENLIQGEFELRTEIQLMLGSDLLTYGLDKVLLLIKELMGRADTPTISTLKYEVIRLKPPPQPEERRKVEQLYYEKVNAPVKKFIDALGPRIRKIREFLRDADEVVDQEIREVAAKEIVQRLRSTASDFGFDLNQISKRTGELLGHMVNLFREMDLQKVQAPEYQAVVRIKSPYQTGRPKPQIIIIQQGSTLRFLGGSKLNEKFSDISPQLLYDTLRRYLLTKASASKNKAK
ncbi:MAG: hypothetical protein ACTSRS_17815 [Candidatus Helarchaeota archaeon]